MTQFVPIEFIGLARDLRRRLVAADREGAAIVTRLLTPIRARYARNPRPRKEALIDLARAWRRDLPAFGRLGLDIEMDRKGLVLREHRACAAEICWPRWAEKGPEPGVLVMTSGFTVRRDVFLHTRAAHAIVSQHALARRYQRGRCPDDAAILADLALLIETPPDACQIPTPDGRWVGERTEIAGPDGKSARHLAVRTFLEPDRPYRAALALASAA